MAFKASNQLAPAALSEAKTLALRIKSRCEAAALTWETSGANVNDIMGVLQQLKQMDDRFSVLLATPGLAAFAVEYENSPGYDVVAEFQALRSAMQTAYTSLLAAVPTDGTYALIYTIDANSNLIPRQFSAASLAPHIANFDAIVLAVE